MKPRKLGAVFMRRRARSLSPAASAFVDAGDAAPTIETMVSCGLRLYGYRKERAGDGNRSVRA